MKRAVFWTVFLVSLALCFSAGAVESTEGDWEYEIEDKTARITDYNPSDNPPEVLIVPETLGGYRVTEIGYAFSNYRHLPDGKSEEMPGPRVLVLPDTVREVRQGGIGFEDLEEIRVDSEYYQAVDGVLFERKTGTLVAYPQGKKDRSYRTPEFAQAIAENAFGSSDFLKEVIVTDNVRSIEKRAFHVFHLRIVLPEHIAAIQSGFAVFADEFVSESPRFQVINGMLIDTEKKELLCVPYESGDEHSRIITVPEGVETIGDEAFSFVSCDQLLFPSTLKAIGKSNDISDIYSGSLAFPEGLESIGDNFRISNVKKIVFPASLKSIGYWCFRYISNLESVVFREGITSIGYQSFCNNGSLKTVVLPQTLWHIGEKPYSKENEAFIDCPNLQAFVLPGSSAESFCRRMNIPYEYTYEGLWQAEEREAAEVLSLPGAEQVQIRLTDSTLELSYVLDGSEHRETYRINWKNGRLCMDGGYMNYFMDGRELTLEMNHAELHLTRAEES